MAPAKKKTATTPVEAPVSVEAPDVATSSAKAPVEPLVLPEQVPGFNMLKKFGDMYLEEQEVLNDAMIALGTKIADSELNEFKKAILVRDFLAEFVEDREVFLEMFKGGDARIVAFTLYATWMAELKK